jgi:hypothetical protein
MFGRQIVEFLHKRTPQICSLLGFGEWWFLSLQTICYKNRIALFLDINVIAFKQFPLVGN